MVQSSSVNCRFLIASAVVSILLASAGCGVISFSIDPTTDGGIKKTAVVGPVTSGDSLMVVAGPEYEAGGFHKWLWGEHYRAEWTTPFKVPVLDLGS